MYTNFFVQKFILPLKTILNKILLFFFFFFSLPAFCYNLIEEGFTIKNNNKTKNIKLINFQNCYYNL